MNIAVIGTSKKENEKRVAIHPQHIRMIPENIRRHLFFEKGYGAPFGMPDDKIAFLTGNRLMEREKLLKGLGAAIIPKPMEEDLEQMQDGALVWGWVHSVQQKEIAQIAIDKKMTLIAWENMYSQGARSRTHIFQKNNELAGYCAVQHALELRGIDGNFGLPRKVAVISLGSVSRGAIYALKCHGFHDITVYTQRPPYLVSDKIPGIQYSRMYRDESGAFTVESPCGESKPMADELACSDIIVNGTLQNPSEPAIFIRDCDIVKFTKECLIIDISCDMGMGFSFAHPTHFSDPICRIHNFLYYSVDHTPTLLWDSSSWEISNGLLPYLGDVVEQAENPVLEAATDIKGGIIMNKSILSYQNRSPVYPYRQRVPVGAGALHAEVSEG
ncbi:MAG: N(5)-(carboxyethyl)ornithine synthase [Clostridia bacterium]|nr:N(5)-(carboxyethyl)ornithine synthase [Clostridia bacterium]MDR3643802.1 N(5)-(carboxyethyl)ornithine synthase [Clostridia bacterium]